MNATITNPFTILIDTAEGQPFSFDGLTRKGVPLTVPREFRALGRWPDSLGDYSIEGYVGRVAVERKSKEDFASTLLGWQTRYEKGKGLKGRRDKFKDEMANLNAIECAAVVVEASFPDCMSDVPEFGVRSAADNRAILISTTISLMQDYPRVQFLFCDGRRSAETTCFRWLNTFWRKEHERMKAGGAA